MQAPAFAAEQPAGDRFAGERVAEREHVGRLFYDQAPVDQSAQRVEKAVLAKSGHRSEKVERDPFAQDRRGIYGSALLRLETVEMPEDRLGQCLGKRIVGELSDRDVPGGHEELFQEERVSPCTAVESSSGGVVDLGRSDGRDERGDVAHPEATDIHVLDVLVPFHG